MGREAVEGGAHYPVGFAQGTSPLFLLLDAAPCRPPSILAERRAVAARTAETPRPPAHDHAEGEPTGPGIRTMANRGKGVNYT